jgi:uncharacterized delta-60 repeat protein
MIFSVLALKRRKGGEVMGTIIKAKWILAFVAIVLVISSPCYAEWAETYGGTGDDVAHSIRQTSDGGYIVAGETESFGAGYEDFWVLKLNSDGTIAWQKTYGMNNWDVPHSIQQTLDGGYIVAGGVGPLGANIDDVWVLKLNSDGTVAWQKSYGGTGEDIAHSIHQTSDGGYIVAGKTRIVTGAGHDESRIIKLNSDGTVAWQKSYYGGTWDYFYSIQQTSDGGYIVAGETHSNSMGSTGVWVLKLNSDGWREWPR